MVQTKNNKKKILELFFDYPLEQFYLRQISRKTGIAVTSVKKYLNDLIKEKLIVKVDKGIYPSFKADRDNDKGLFRLHKTLSIIERINSSGLLDYLWDSLYPEAIILYGSASRGEDIEGSDIDFFIVGKEKTISLDRFEKNFHREIHLMFKDNPKKIPEKLKSNLINGIVLKGYFDI
mgnify:CR=1 FL=1